MCAALTREATFDRASADKATRTVRASLSSEAPVMQMGVQEVLRHDAASVDLSRAANGLPLLVSHDRTALPVGVIEGVHLENRRLVGTLRFGQSTRASEVWNDVQDGVLRNVSVSYSVQQSEASPDTTATTERQRASDITLLCTRHKVPAETMSRYISEGTAIDLVRAAVLDDLAKRDMASGGHLNVMRSGYMLGHDQGDQSRALMEAAIGERIGGARVEASNPFRHARIIDIARERAEVAGIRTTAMPPSQILDRAYSESDFPAILGNAVNKVLALRYSSYPGGLKRASRPTTIKDFRAKLQLRLGEVPALLKVNELGEYKQGGMLDAKESYALATYGRIVTISRQALINDDLSAFESLGLRFAQQAAEMEASMLATLLTSNPTMNQDATALFHANHGNLATGGGSALSLTALSTARKSMRLQKGLDGATPIDATPKFLVVPAALETTGEQLLTQLMATQFENVNPFGGKLELIVEPRLDAASATAWYLSADPALLDTIEYAYLDGEAGPQIFVEQLFGQDGMSMKCREDFGCGVLDFRGLFKSAGA